MSQDNQQPGIITIPEWKTLQGSFEIRFTTDGQNNYFLKTKWHRDEYVVLHSGKFNVERLVSLPPENEIQVSGIMEHGRKPYTITVDKAVILKTGTETHFPAIDLENPALDIWFTAPAPVAMTAKTTKAKATQKKDACPADIRSEIQKNLEQIKSSAEKLNTIDWKKYAAIGGMVVGLLSSTISLLISAIPVAGPFAAGGLLISKVMALYTAVDSLKNLDEWARAEAKLMKNAKENLDRLKTSYPACFK